jgi:hypothetical protein
MLSKTTEFFTHIDGTVVDIGDGLSVVWIKPNTVQWSIAIPCANGLLGFAKARCTGFFRPFAHFYLDQ